MFSNVSRVHVSVTDIYGSYDCCIDVCMCVKSKLRQLHCRMDMCVCVKSKLD